MSEQWEVPPHGAKSLEGAERWQALGRAFAELLGDVELYGMDPNLSFRYKRGGSTEHYSPRHAVTILNTIAYLRKERDELLGLLDEALPAVCTERDNCEYYARTGSSKLIRESNQEEVDRLTDLIDRIQATKEKVSA